MEKWLCVLIFPLKFTHGRSAELRMTNEPSCREVPEIAPPTVDLSTCLVFLQHITSSPLIMCSLTCGPAPTLQTV